MLSVLQNNPELTNAIGIAGCIVYVLNFFLLQVGRLCGDREAYALMQVLAASLVLVSLINAFNIAALLIQISFISIGIFGVCRKRILARRSRHGGAEAVNTNADNNPKIST